MNGHGVRPNKLWHWFAVAFLVATFLAEPVAFIGLSWQLFRAAGAVGGELLTGDPDPDVLNLNPDPDADSSNSNPGSPDDANNGSGDGEAGTAGPASNTVLVESRLDPSAPITWRNPLLSPSGIGQAGCESNIFDCCPHIERASTNIAICLTEAFPPARAVDPHPDGEPRKDPTNADNDTTDDAAGDGS